MGCGIYEEFMPLTPIKTSPPTRTRITLVSESKSPESDHGDGLCFEENECQTPKSLSDILTSPPVCVCPPAPVKPRPPRRKLALPPGRFCKVPADLASIFVPVEGCVKKLRACWRRSGVDYTSTVHSEASVPKQLSCNWFYTPRWENGIFFIAKFVFFFFDLIIILRGDSCSLYIYSAACVDRFVRASFSAVSTNIRVFYFSLNRT